MEKYSLFFFSFCVSAGLTTTYFLKIPLADKIFFAPLIIFSYIGFFIFLHFLYILFKIIIAKMNQFLKEVLEDVID